MTRSILKIGNNYLAIFGLSVDVVVWTSAVFNTWARINAIQTVEPYAFAVYEQLMRNFDATGQFSQTIHSGYDDAWTWSGHRALTLPALAKVYGLHPSAFLAFANHYSMCSIGLDSDRIAVSEKMKSKWVFSWVVCVLGVTSNNSFLITRLSRSVSGSSIVCRLAMWAFSTGNWFLSFVEQLLEWLLEKMCPHYHCTGCIMWPYKKKTFG